MNKTEHIPVTIIGGGPVGLFLAICLLKKGIECKVLERREKPVPDSRSLGIHPVSLELFDKTGITQPFLNEGLKIKKGLALTRSHKLGEISFSDCPKPHNYVLACPQFATERILREELTKLSKDALLTGVQFEKYIEQDKQVEVRYLDQSGKSERIWSTYLVGCDGKQSLVRRQAAIHYSGKRYSDTYIMGDFEDTTEFGTDAVIFLPKEGLIECFPLPNGMRRWVVKTPNYAENPEHSLLASLVKNRVGFDLHSVKSTMLSSFGVQHFMAETMAKGRILLAGDSAHVVSPIGGQGMNLGWLDGWELADSLQSVTHSSGTLDNESQILNAYSSKQRKVVKKAARRAEFNMMLGRQRKKPFLRNLIVKGMLQSPAQQKVAELFTMRGLSSWWI